VASLQEGTLFAGRYRIVRRIAAGGMGEVYEVVHLETERRRALKVMHADILGSDDLRERFKREAKVAAHVESEFIVDVFDAGVDDATRMPFMVMELLRGEELGQRIKRVGRLAPEEAITYLQQTARALEKTHRAGIIHRDLKPENLFLMEREEGPPTIKVLDFGIAKIVVDGMTAGSTQAIGTPLYMAPEQFNPHARITGAVDIYALGMVAFTLLVGAPYWAPEKAGGIYALTAVAMFGPKEPASARARLMGAALSPAFDAWFARITAVAPEHRFGSAMEAVRALAEALGVAAPGRVTAPSLSEIDVGSRTYERASGPAYDRASSPVMGVTPGAAPAGQAAHFAAPAASAAATERYVEGAAAPITNPTALSGSITGAAPARSKVAIFGAALVGSALLFGLAGFALYEAREGTSGADAPASSVESTAPAMNLPAAAPARMEVPSPAEPLTTATEAAPSSPVVSASGDPAPKLEAAGIPSGAQPAGTDPKKEAASAATPKATAKPAAVTVPPKKKYTRD
jgi:tRNA A-37 threonylcarbamoyl transferase component Bud32